MNFNEFKNQFQDSLYDEYAVTLHLNDVAGGTPMHKDLITGWINATNKNKSEEERNKIIEATIKTLPEVAEEKEAKSWVGFKRDKDGYLYLEGRCVKAMLKEAANIIKQVVPVSAAEAAGKSKKSNAKGITNLKSKVADRVFVVENRVFFERDGERIRKPDELEERPIHAMTPQGPRSSLKRTDILRGVDVKFTVRRLADNTVPETALYACLVYAQQLGLGSDRAQGRGTSNDVQCIKTKAAGKPMETE